jgi:hypothetical protein
MKASWLTAFRRLSQAATLEGKSGLTCTGFANRSWNDLREECMPTKKATKKAAKKTTKKKATKKPAAKKSVSKATKKGAGKAKLVW